MRFLLLTCFSLLSLNVFADWTLDSQKSELTFNTTKNAAVTETHHFNDFSGSIKPDGTAQLTINTATVQTNIDKRDQRLRDLFFKVANFPESNIGLSIPKDFLTAQKVGTQKVLETNAQISLVGKTVNKAVTLNVTYIAKDQVEVSSGMAVVLDVKEFGLLAGLNKLKNLAGLKSIDETVPVSFKLIFTK
jgi:polyisoprenoid-binding protein YceI